jgi:hypothetical protein
VLGRRYHELRRDVLELAEIVALDVLELELKHPRVRPLALGPEPHVTDQGLQGRFADVIGELVVVEAFGGRDCLLQKLKLGVAPRRNVVS